MIWTKFLLLSNPLSLSTHIEEGEKKRETRHPLLFPSLRIEVLLFKNWNRIFKTRLPPSPLSLSHGAEEFLFMGKSTFREADSHLPRGA